MKYVKILGLLAVAAAAMMAFAASASATTITSPTGTTATSLHASAEGHVTLDSPVGAIKCGSTAGGAITTQGSGVTAGGALETLEFTGCTEGWHVTVLAKGSLEAHHTSGYDGTLTSSGAEVSATVGGITCVYGTAATHIGTVTGGSPATLDITAKIPVIAAKSSIFCGTQATTWTGSYTTSGALYIDA